MERARSERTPWWSLPVLLAAAFLLFGGVLGLSPFSDDHSALFNSGVRGIPWRNGFFRPLSDLTFRIGDLLWGTSVQGHRAFNVVVHGLNAFLLFLLVHRSAATGEAAPRTFTAFAAALPFVAYPFHQESIVWLVGRESALGTFFTLLGVLAAGSTWPVHWRGVAAACSMVVGALCYESTLLMPLMLLVLAWLGHLPKERALLAPLAIGVVVYGGLRVVLAEGLADTYSTGLFAQPLSAYALHLPKVIARLFLPPDPEPTRQMLKGAVLLTFLFAVGYFVYRHQRKRLGSTSRLRTWGALLAVALILPVIAGVSTITSESDRFLYMPSAFLCGGIALAAQSIAARGLRMATIGVLLVACVYFAGQNHANWEQASSTTERIIAELPPLAADRPTYFTDLPDSFNGAFIFRNGFAEAVHLAGKDGDRVVDVRVGMARFAANLVQVTYRGTTLTVEPEEAWYQWTGERFVSLTGPPESLRYPEGRRPRSLAH